MALTELAAGRQAPRVKSPPVFVVNSWSMDGTGTDRLAEALAALPDVAGMPDHERYERLTAAAMLRWLDERTVHDVKLTGHSTALHQIDVVVGDDHQRALVECKYYSSNIDMPIVEKFFGTKHDVGCDLAMLVTTQGYSENARRFAGAHGIDLLLLREATEQDMEVRVGEVIFSLTAVGVTLHDVRMEIPHDAVLPQNTRRSVMTDDPTVVIEQASGERQTFGELYDSHRRTLGLSADEGIYSFVDEFDPPARLVMASEEMALARIVWELRVSRDTTVDHITSTPLATLLTADGEVLEIVGDTYLQGISFGPEDSPS